MRPALLALLLVVSIALGCSSTEPPLIVIETLPAATDTPVPTPDGAITIAAMGDVMLARDVTMLMNEHGARYPFELVWGLLEDADLTIANLESAFTERGVEQVKAYTFRVPPRFALGLAEAGIDIVSLGNNHTADYGPEGVADTLAALDAASIAYAGAGMNEAQARRPAFVETEGLRLAFLSYTDIMENTFAGPSSAGVALATTDAIAADVQAARTRAEIVIVALHSGIEYTDAPQPNQQALARAAIDAGARLVIGHHPHTLQGRERYGNGLIVYSLGNFVFDLDNEDLSNLGPRAFQSAVLYVTLSATEVLDVRAVPVTIDPDEDRPRPATTEEAATINARLAELDVIADGG